MQIQPQEILDRLNKLWAIHAHGLDPRAEVRSCCMALVVDPRYVMCDGFESRLAVSFGDNPFSPEMVTGFVPPPYKPGKYLFGLHNVGVSENQLTVYDLWMSSKPSIDCASPEYVLRTSERILAQVGDEEYRKLCSCGERGDLQRSHIWLLEELEIVPVEHF